ncbi:NAD(P)/FAD-dependent oxidoreductase [Maricurvus nonylphenolicus]|uniref:phytoene desaturase family protein n=1 Tax=Maricurvus nonylphenolicus TaxID=1008307 RepID=UPI0036F1DF13
MNTYDAIVIGAGNGGLVGALTLAKAGKKVLLLEKHNIPGGAATTFVRGRFEFDVALHTLWGIGTDDNKGALREIFEKLDVYDKLEFVEQKEIFTLNVKDRFKADFPYEKSAYLDTLCAISPDEADNIRAYQDLLDRMAEEFYRLYDHLGEDINEENFPLMFEMGARSGEEVLHSYIKHPVIRAAYSILDGYTGIHVSKIPFLLLGCLYELGGGHHVKGGAQAMSNAIIEEFEACGGRVIYHAEVDKINIDNNQVTGVHLKDGREFQANRILSNANKVRTYVDFIDEKQVPESLFMNLKPSKPGSSIFALYIGLNCSPDKIGLENGINYLMDPSIKSITADARNNNIDWANSVYMSCYNIDDPDYSEPNTSAITVLVGNNVEPWMNLSQQEYHDRKFKLADNVLDLLEKFHPGIRDHIEELELSTPLTHMRYLGSPGGAIYSHSANFKDLITNKLDPRSPIEGLYFCGASIIVGGFNGTYMTGHSVGSLMLKEMTEEAA